MDISLVLREIVDILPISPMPYFDYVITMASACACFHRQWPKLLMQIVSNWEFMIQIG